MRHKFDFTLCERKYDDICRDGYKIVFRMYPAQSHVHVGDVLKEGKTREDIYKSYFRYSVFRNRYDLDDNGDFLKQPYLREVLFDSEVDEGSAICEGNFPAAILEVVTHKDMAEQVIMPFGEGVEWRIERRALTEYDWETNKEFETPFYCFSMFDFNGKGFRFNLNQPETIQFANFLEGFVSFMLKHAEEI